jgi:hypothetical protein
MHFIGDPEHQIDDWQYQDLPDNCAVAAQTSIINHFHPNHHLSVDDATQIAYDSGFYHPGSGTSIDDMGKMFDTFGIPNHQVDHSDIRQLAEELQGGHSVIVGINSGQLWDQGPLGEFWHWFIKELGVDNLALFNPADHAVSVTGINVTDPGHPSVVINDSGEPYGAGHEYPLDKFMEAWKGSDFHYVATDHAPSAFAGLEGIDFGKWTGIGAGVSAGIGTLANGGDLSTAVNVGFGVGQTVSDATNVMVDAVGNVDWDHLLADI